MAEHSVNIVIPKRWIVGLHLVGAALGFGAAFAVGPIVRWLLGLAGDAPGALRLAAGLPLEWAIPMLTLVGLGVGHWIARGWQQENGTIAVADEGVTVHRSGFSGHVPRDRIDGVFTDAGHLVVIDDRTDELLRVKADEVLVASLRTAFEQLGYPWQGTTDPHEDAFIAWVDGHGSLGARMHDLLRTRQRALSDKHAGAADDARDALRTFGVVVRDRKDVQQYRVIPPTP